MVNAPGAPIYARKIIRKNDPGGGEVLLSTHSSLVLTISKRQGSEADTVCVVLCTTERLCIEYTAVYCRTEKTTPHEKRAKKKQKKQAERLGGEWGSWQVFYSKKKSG